MHTEFMKIIESEVEGPPEFWSIVVREKYACEVSEEHHSFISMEDLNDLFNITDVGGYPLPILKRRLNLLTESEREDLVKTWVYVQRNIEYIENVITKRASIANDPWQIRIAKKKKKKKKAKQ